MKAFERYFYSEHGAARSYLFAKLFLLMLALDTWMLMIGHAGRYGMTGFNVAHFAWLDRILPLPTAGFYIAVLLLTGLLSLVLVLAGLSTIAVFALFLLYTLSWSMSMLDSYQHHYFMSLVLLCLTFFPDVRASELHALPPPAPQPTHKPSKAELKRAEQARKREAAGWIYAASVVGLAVTYAFVDTHEHVFTAFLLLAGAIGVASLLYDAPSGAAPAMRAGFGFNLLGATVAVLYVFTAMAKIDERWLAGDTILAISRVEEAFAKLADLAGRFGIERSRFWSLFATSVIPQEFFLAFAYLVAVQQDRLRALWPRVVCTAGFAAAVALHVGAEAMGLEIGWFSYYMLALACAFLLPLPAVDRLVTVFTWPARAIDLAFAESDTPAPGQWKALPLVFSGGAALLLLAVGPLIHLPGAVAACAIAAVVLFGVSLARFVRGDGVKLLRLSAAAVVGAVGMWAAIAASPVRFDFYRYLGGDLSRRGEPRAALEAYEEAERFAPPGKSRAKNIERLRRELGE